MSTHPDSIPQRRRSEPSADLQSMTEWRGTNRHSHAPADETEAARWRRRHGILSSSQMKKTTKMTYNQMETPYSPKEVDDQYMTLVRQRIHNAMQRYQVRFGANLEAACSAACLGMDDYTAVMTGVRPVTIPFLRQIEMLVQESFEFDIHHMLATDSQLTR